MNKKQLLAMGYKPEHVAVLLGKPQDTGSKAPTRLPHNGRIVIGPQDYPQTPSGALEELKNQIAWIEYVPDNEFTASESARLIRACERLTIVIQRLNHKYND